MIIMNQIIIPEIIRNKIPSKSDPNNLNITLNKIDRRNYSTNHEHFTSNTTTTVNVKSGGFFRFIFDLISLPFKIVYNSTKYIFEKYDLKNKLELEKISIQKDRWKKKWLGRQRDIWNNDEIF